MTILSTCFLASLIGVQFGWAPAAETTPGADGYDYLVRVSAEDLEALRDGRALDLVSELPDDIRPLERVRVYVGEGAAPRRLTRSDQNSPRRISSTSEPKRHEVAKPVAPEWKDASRLVGPDRGADQKAESDAERHTVYQARDNLNLRGLSEGFREGTRPIADAGRWVESQTRDLADGTRSVLDQSGQAIQRGAQDLVRNTEEVFDRATDPYGSRQLYDANGQPLDRQVAPPELSTPSSQRTIQQAPAYTDPQAGSLPYEQERATQAQYDGREAQYTDQPQARFNDRQYDGYSAPRLNDQRDQRTNAPSGSLAESFTDGDPRYDSSRGSTMSPVPRDYSRAPSFNESRAVESDPWRAFDDRETYAARRETAPASRSDVLDPPAFADLPASRADSVWADEVDRAAPPATDRFVNDRSPQSSAAAGQGAGVSPTGWAGGSAAQQTDSNAAALAAQAAARQANDQNSQFWQSILLVILGAATCFTWIAYIDVRNKYRAVLRNAPAGSFHHSAAA